MANTPDNRSENKEPAEGSRETVDESLRHAERGGRGEPMDQPSRHADRGTRGPLDGSTSGTIGGGGPESGGPSERAGAPDMPPVHPEDAASGRRAPDTLGAAEPHELFKTPPTDVNRD